MTRGDKAILVGIILLFLGGLENPETGGILGVIGFIWIGLVVAYGCGKITRKEGE